MASSSGEFSSGEYLRSWMPLSRGDSSCPSSRLLVKKGCFSISSSQLSSLQPSMYLSPEASSPSR